MQNKFTIQDIFKYMVKNIFKNIIYHMTNGKYLMQLKNVVPKNWVIIFVLVRMWKRIFWIQLMS